MIALQHARARATVAESPAAAAAAAACCCLQPAATCASHPSPLAQGYTTCCSYAPLVYHS